MKTKILLMKKNFLYGTVILCLLILIYFVVLIQSPEKVTRLTREDGIIESLAAVFYFFAAGLLFYLFFKSKSVHKKHFLKTKRNYFFLLLGLFFLFCGGEEISWGQRIFEIATTDRLKEINNQGETNIHNLYIFARSDKNNNFKTGLELWITGERIFALFWVFYCLLIPIINTFSSKVRNFTRKIHFPVIPLWIGIIFLLNHLLSKLFERIELFSINSHAVVEIKETNFAFLFFVVSISLYVIYKSDADHANIN